jgi:glycosyltransferase involved in cell wall biosynthesis
MSRLLYYPRREWQFLRWLKRRPDVVTVHLQEWKPWLAGWMVARIRRMGKRSFYTVHNVLPHRYPRLLPRRLVDHWIRSACLRCDGLFVHTRRLADELALFLGEQRPPIAVVPHGVWTVRDAEPAPPMRQRLARKRLLLFGAIRRNKGIDLLLRAAALLPGYELTIAGEPVEAEYFESEVMPLVHSLRQAGAKVRVIDRFVPDEEVGRLFAEHSAVVLPYTREFVAQSGVVFLALAYGVPVVASGAGGLCDLLGEYEIGTTFEGRSAEGLAAALRRLHEESDGAELERNIAAACRRFTWHAAAGATIAAYASAEESAAAAHGLGLPAQEGIA